MDERADYRSTEAELEALINEEKRALARAYGMEAWEAGCDDGIGEAMLARVLLRTVLTEARASGVDTAGLIREMDAADQCGEFDPDRVLQ